MPNIEKPRRLLALLACLMPALVVSARPPRGDTQMRSAASSETVFRHYL